LLTVWVCLCSNFSKNALTRAGRESIPPAFTQRRMCLFLEKKEGINKWLCRIHDFKPAACREWAAGLEKQECRKGLQRHWGLSVANSGKLTGTSENLAGFLNFLKDA